MNENNNNYVIDDNFTFNDKIIYVPMSKNTNNISYNTTSNTNTVINNNMNKPIIKNKENILDYCQIKNIERTRIKLYNYLSGYYDKKIVSIQYGNSIKEEERNKYDSDFTKDTLNNNFLHYLEKLKVKCSNDYLVYYFKNFKEKKKNDSNLYIDIFCPFFNLLSTQEYFIDLFTIPIDMSFIKKNKLTNEYILAFDRLNQLKQNYSILFKFYNIEDFTFFNKCINLNKVNKLGIYLEQTEEEKYPLIEEVGKNNYGENYTKSIKYRSNPYEIFKNKFICLFNTITSCNNYLLNNLQYLKISAKTNDYLFFFDLDEYHLAEKLNNFKSLSHLELEYFKFEEPKFELKLNSVKVFKISHCTGITISENVCSNLKELFIYKSDISYKKSPLKFPNLVKLQFYNNLDDHIKMRNDKFMKANNSSIDFTSLNNLKILKVEEDGFLKLKNNT